MLYSMSGLPCLAREWVTLVGRRYTVRLFACINSKTAWQLLIRVGVNGLHRFEDNVFLGYDAVSLVFDMPGERSGFVFSAFSFEWKNLEFEGTALFRSFDDAASYTTIMKNSTNAVQKPLKSLRSYKSVKNSFFPFCRFLIVLYNVRYIF
jgi:hypothetical protein